VFLIGEVMPRDWSATAGGWREAAGGCGEKTLSCSEKLCHSSFSHSVKNFVIRSVARVARNSQMHSARSAAPIARGDARRTRGRARGRGGGGVEG
jgi:hypothetical protein